MGFIAGLCCFVAGGVLWWVRAETPLNDTVVENMINGASIVMFAVGIIFILYSAMNSRKFR